MHHCWQYKLLLPGILCSGPRGCCGKDAPKAATEQMNITSSRAVVKSHGKGGEIGRAEKQVDSGSGSCIGDC